VGFGAREAKGWIDELAEEDRWVGSRGRWVGSRGRWVGPGTLAIATFTALACSVVFKSVARVRWAWAKKTRKGGPLGAGRVT
jgi:hypothetical protein